MSGGADNFAIGVTGHMLQRLTGRDMLLLERRLTRLRLASEASAQSTTSSIPNYGNNESLTDNFRIDIRVSDPLFGLPTIERSFEQSKNITSHIDPEMAAYLGQGTVGKFY